MQAGYRNASGTANQARRQTLRFALLKVSHMNVKELALPGILQFDPKVFPDARGYFFEAYRSEICSKYGIPSFVQDNQSHSTRGALRGLHYQLEKPQGKLVRVLRGAIFDVAVDIRMGSPHFGKWLGVELSAENKVQLYIPPGYAHGFCVIGDEAEVLYKCTDYYSGAADQRGVKWDDVGIGVRWPVTNPLISAQDQAFAGLFTDRRDLPNYGR